MEQYVLNFTNQLREAIEIGKNASLKGCTKQFTNVVITGLGGSGIGGKIVSQIALKESTLPIYVNNNYSLPGFVGQNTLVIVSSYSGNTEETVSAMKEALAKNAEIACITSGGEVLEIAKKHELNYIEIPGGNPPRASLGYSLTQQFVLLHHYGVITDTYKTELPLCAALLDNNLIDIQTTAKNIANKLYKKTPIIYSESSFEGVAIRLRQQLNENAKVLCWHHCLPEMNHNELVGWAGGDDQKAVIFLRNENDFDRTQVRMNLSKEIIGKHTSTIIEVLSKGDSAIQKSIYHIHLGDWISVYLAQLNKVDPIEVNVISRLKAELAKV